MKPTEMLLEKILSTAEDYNWFGFKKTGERSMGCHGSFTSFSTHVKGFEIVVTRHEYPEGVTPHPKVIGRRAVSASEKTWTEITVNDTFARFGRRVIIDRIALTREHGFIYDKACALFGIASRKGKMFTPNADSRISREEAMLATCKAL